MSEEETLRRRIAELTAEAERLRASEAELGDREAELRILFEGAPDAIYMLDLKGTVLDFNAKAEELVGFSRSELVGRSVLKMGGGLIPFSQMPRVAKLLALSVAGQAIGPEPLLLNQKQGGQVRVELHSFPLRIRGRRVVMGIARDITRRYEAEKTQQRLERQASEAARLEAVGTLSAGIAHTFNNLLTPIRGYAELMMFRPDDADRVAAGAEAIITAADEAAELVRKLMAYTRGSSPPTAPVDLHEVIEAVVGRACPAESTVEVVLELTAAPSTVAGDSDDLERALGELVENALEAMQGEGEEGGGTLTITTRVDDIAAIDAAASSPHAFEMAPAGRWVVVEVRDTGPGLSEQTRRHMFEPFFTTKDIAEGAGMGLPMAQGIIAVHQGEITVESSDAGTTFKVHFPPAPADASS